MPEAVDHYQADHLRIVRRHDADRATICLHIAHAAQIAFARCRFYRLWHSPHCGATPELSVTTPTIISRSNCAVSADTTWRRLSGCCSYIGLSPSITLETICGLAAGRH